jgi:hypothetical protein
MSAQRQKPRNLRQRRRDALNRSAGKGIVGYPTIKRPAYPPLQFVGKDHSQRPAGSTKRLGRKRGPGGGGVQGAMARLADSLQESRS